jgi:hypothetical protein
VGIEAIARRVGLAGAPRRQRDLTGLAGRWRDDPEFDAAIAAQDAIDEEI